MGLRDTGLGTSNIVTPLEVQMGQLSISKSIVSYKEPHIFLVTSPEQQHLEIHKSDLKFCVVEEERVIVVQKRFIHIKREARRAGQKFGSTFKSNRNNYRRI